MEDFTIFDERVNMKLVTFLFLLCCNLSIAQMLDDEGQRFIHSFEMAVREHNTKDVFRHLDKKYRKEQIRFLKGNKKQFINELFSGENEAGSYMTPEFNTIHSITLVDAKELEGEIATYEVGFEVDIPDYTLYSTLILVRKKKKYVLIGAVG